MLVLLSGLLPNPKLETSVLSICLNTGSLAYMFPFGFGAAVSTQVSNELGAGHSHAARLAVYAVFFMSITEAVLVGSLLFSIRNVWGHAYSNEKEVVDYVASMIPLLAASSLLDGIQGALSGVARGCGWQKLGAYINLGAFYIVGIPIAFLLAFVLHVGGRVSKMLVGGLHIVGIYVWAAENVFKNSTLVLWQIIKCRAWPMLIFSNASS